LCHSSPFPTSPVAVLCPHSKAVRMLGPLPAVWRGRPRVGNSPGGRGPTLLLPFQQLEQNISTVRILFFCRGVVRRAFVGGSRGFRRFYPRFVPGGPVNSIYESSFLWSARSSLSLSFKPTLVFLTHFVSYPGGARDLRAQRKSVRACRDSSICKCFFPLRCCARSLLPFVSLPSPPILTFLIARVHWYTRVDSPPGPGPMRRREKERSRLIPLTGTAFSRPCLTCELPVVVVPSSAEYQLTVSQRPGLTFNPSCQVPS